MTILAVSTALLAGISLFFGWYFRQAETGAVEAGPIWDRLSANLNRFVMDESVPDSVAEEATIFASIAGCGCMAASVVIHAMRKDISKGYRKRVESEPLRDDIRGLGQAQRALLAAILSDIIRIDLAVCHYFRRAPYRETAPLPQPLPLLSVLERLEVNLQRLHSKPALDLDRLELPPRFPACHADHS